MRTFIRFRYNVRLLVFEFLLFTFLLISILPNSPSSQSIEVFQSQLLFSKFYKYKSDTSIAFYIVGSANQTFDPDLRGNFWEPLLEMGYFNYTIHYIGDYEFTVNGVTFIDIRKSYNFTTNDPSDRRLCERVSFSYQHFIDHHPNTKWYFKGGHDTFVNVPELLKLIESLEEKEDPMTNYNFAYNLHLYSLGNHEYYPQVGAGFLASNFAIKQFYHDPKVFKTECQKSYDDVSLASMFQIHNLDLFKYVTSKFIVIWPRKSKSSKKFDLHICPDYYRNIKSKKILYTCSAYMPASIHFHKFPMEDARTALETMPKDWGIYYKSLYHTRFCLLRNNITENYVDL